MNVKLKEMRQLAKLTQEQLAEKMNVSRQSVAKWENGESIPDIAKCCELAKIFDMEIEDIASMFIQNYDTGLPHPKNRYLFGVSRIVDNKIILPEEALNVFELKNGDDLIVLGDITQGIALLPKKGYNDFISLVNNFDVLGEEKNENGN